MLYRIQTLYLFISIFIYSVYLYYFLIIFTYNFFFLRKIFVLICLILSILSILSFKRKKLQIFMNKTNILVTGISLITFFYPSCKIKISVFFVFLCLCNIFFLWMANKGIKKDIKLIDSMNRIR
ncbi:DUF4293 family protein [Blattabacterium cuenoti]|uniref:DUF4293 family protein n=1 Tax=Blattabacterium cuenoti TaxID=1653831 RepID=UPI00163BBE4F|nr:DUF4293 family protein [Blattabacterium cuenoti]